MITKAEQLAELMKAGDWTKALAMAARFPRLGKHRDAITRGHEATTNASFYKQIGKDPEMLRKAGIEALRDKYANLI